MLRVSYGRSIKAEQLLKELGITTYNPLHVVVKMVRGHRRRVQLPLLPGLLFVHAEPTFLDATIKEPAVRALLSYYYDHFQQTALGNNPPLTVSDSSMSAVSRRNTVFSPMKDLGSLFQPNPPAMSSKMRSFPPRRL